MSSPIHLLDLPLSCRLRIWKKLAPVDLQSLCLVNKTLNADIFGKSCAENHEIEYAQAMWAERTLEIIVSETNESKVRWLERHPNLVRVEIVVYNLLQRKYTNYNTKHRIHQMLLD